MELLASRYRSFWHFDLRGKAIALSLGLWLIGSLVTPAQAANPNLANCATAPKNAKVVLPAPVDRFASVFCSNWGAFISAPKGFRWKLHNAETPVLIPADPNGDRTLPGWNAYFTKIESKPAATAAAVDIANYLSDLFGLPTVPDRVILLTVETNGGLKHEIYFAVFGGRIAGLACPQCAKTLPFAVIKD